MLIRQNPAISSFIIKPSNEKQTFFISKKDKTAENVSARLNKQKGSTIHDQQTLRHNGIQIIKMAQKE